MADDSKMDVEECPISYEELQDLEKEFELAENEILRQQIALTKPLYEKREKVVSQIPHFWPLVLEQAPSEVDQYIQPSDAEVLKESLKNITVSHFEAENGAKGDPRSVAIRFEFAPNDFFEDTVLEKKLVYRQSKEGYAGLISEPVPIKWKEGKDLTEGMLDLAIKVWQADKTNPKADGSKPKKESDYSDDEKALKEKIDNTGLGASSFFAFFGYRGFVISDEEHAAAVAKEAEERAARAAGKKTEDKEDDDEDEDDDDEDPLALEIFPDGDEVAVAIAEDLFPNAIKYFTEGQELGDLDDLDLEELDADEMDEDDDDEEGNKADPPAKKRKA